MTSIDATNNLILDFYRLEMEHPFSFPNETYWMHTQTRVTNSISHITYYFPYFRTMKTQ